MCTHIFIYTLVYMCMYNYVYLKFTYTLKALLVGTLLAMYPNVTMATYLCR